MAVPWTLTWVCGTQVNVNSNCDVLRNCLYISHITSCCVWWVVLLPLQLKILVEEDNFKVAVDDVHLLEYEHRVGGFEEVTLVRIVGDVALYSAAPSMIWESDWYHQHPHQSLRRRRLSTLPLYLCFLQKPIQTLWWNQWAQRSKCIIQMEVDPRSALKNFPLFYWTMSHCSLSQFNRSFDVNAFKPLMRWSAFT